MTTITFTNKVGYGARCNLCNLVAASEGLGASARCFRELLVDAPDYERALVNLAGTLQSLADAGPVCTYILTCAEHACCQSVNTIPLQPSLISVLSLVPPGIFNSFASFTLLSFFPLS